MAAKSTYVVLGSRGQLAREFLRVLGDRALGLDRSVCDLTHPRQAAAAIAAVLETNRAGVIINASAMNQVDLAESHPIPALAANARGPALLARLASESGWRLVHFSTDYVFGGDGLQRPRRETDPPAPLNVYGYSKLLGEEAVLGLSPHALVLRVAHLYGGESLSPGRLNLVQRFVQQARQGVPIQVSRDQYLNPTSVRDVVPATLRLLEDRQSGLFHLTGEGACTAEDFVREIFRFSSYTSSIQFVEKDFRPARRSRYTVLANQRLADLGFPPLPDWHDSLAAYVRTL